MFLFLFFKLYGRNGLEEYGVIWFYIDRDRNRYPVARGDVAAVMARAAL